MSRSASADERILVEQVMRVHRKLKGEGKLNYVQNFTKAIDDNSRDFSGGELSAVGEDIQDVYAEQKAADGSYHEQYQFAGPNWDTEFVLLDAKDFQTMTTAAARTRALPRRTVPRSRSPTSSTRRALARARRLAPARPSTSASTTRTFRTSASTR